MSSSTENRVTSKIFIGFELTVDMQINLNNNPEWKQASVVKDENLIIVRYDESEFIGTYVDSSMLTMKEARKYSKEVRSQVASFLNGYDLDSLQITLFPQVFVK